MLNTKRWSVINKKTGKTLASKDTRDAARTVKARYANAYIYDNVTERAVR